MSQGLVLENLMVDKRNVMQQRAQFYADCASTSNRSYLTLHHVVHYSDVISALGSYVFRRSMHFIGV